MCLSWNDTKKMCGELGLKTVPEIYTGLFDLDLVKQIATNQIKEGQEGIVVRNVETYCYDDFNKNIAKVVRYGHVQTDEHWSFSEIIPNKLKNK